MRAAVSPIQTRYNRCPWFSNVQIEMGLGWFGISTFWLLPLLWRTVSRVLAGDRRLFGRGSLRVLMGTVLVLGASATLEALTGGETAEATHALAGGAAGHALAGAVSSMLGWTGGLLMMLAVLGLSAPMVFGETWRSLFQLHRPPVNPEENRPSPKPAARAETRVDTRHDTVSTSSSFSSSSPASSRDDADRWETTSMPSQAGRQPLRQKGIEPVSARRQPAWQPPARTRQSPPQPGEIWLHHADAPGVVKRDATPPSAPVIAARAPSSASSASSASTATKPAQKPVQTPAQKPAARPTPAAAPQATVVSSPFRNPQLGLRSAVTTLPEAMTKPAAAVAATPTVSAAVVEDDAVAVVEAPLPVAAPAATPAQPAVPAEDVVPEDGVTLDSIRAEALALMAELRALAGKPESASETGSLAEAEAAVEAEAEVAVEALEAEAEAVPEVNEPESEVAEVVDIARVELVEEAPLEVIAQPIQEALPAQPSASEAIEQAVAASMAEEQPDDVPSSDEPAALEDANVFVQPAPKPRIVLQAVIGNTVPLAPAQPVATAPVVVAPPPPPAAPREPVDYRLPGVDLLAAEDGNIETVSEERLLQTGELIAQRLAEFKVPVSVVGASAGPVITRFEVDPAVGVRGAQVVGLMKDLARALGVTSIRVVETIPGKTCMGLELPNAKRQMIRLSEIVSGSAFDAHASKLVLAMGKDITGNPVVTDLARAPHLLVAGTTGSGKSVAVNAMILSMLYKATPEDVRLIMIDPKMLELSVYEGIPHLLAPVVTDMKQAAHALNWCVGEMEKRYRLMSALGVRNLAGYNQKIRAAEAAERKVPNPFSLTPDAPEPLSTLPLIVVVIDELADLMMVAGKKIEELIARLAQKARAAGIHLILATQRPSVDVITGLIKANIPTRVAFQVSSKIDSRTILDQMGAESLLGQGDMLFLPPGTGYPQRVHGAFVADEEVHRVVEHWKQFGEPDYEEAILAGDAPEGAADLFGEGGGDAEADPLYDDAAQFVLTSRRASISAVQRHLRIGYNRSARLIEQMEVAGLVSPMGRNGTREVIAPGPAD